MPSLKPGDRVLYSPHHCHGHDRDHHGRALFEFVHLEGYGSVHRAGDPVDMEEAGKLSRDNNGRLMTEQGHAIKLHRPHRHWPAVVASHEPAAGPDGNPVPVPVDAEGYVVPDAQGRVLIDIAHPRGGITLHYRVAPDEAKAPHTFHLPEGA